MGIADATHDTLDALPGLFMEPGVVDEATLRRLHGPKVNPTGETMASIVTPDMVLKCLASVAPFTTPHKDGWGAERLLSLCAVQDYAATCTYLVATLMAGDVTDITCDLLSSATLVVLLKKSEAEIEALRRKQVRLNLSTTSTPPWHAQPHP
jgi:hypothetical protein